MATDVLGTHGYEPAQVALVDRYLRGDVPPDPFFVRLVQHDTPRRTFARQQLIADQDWYTSAHFQQFRQTIGRDHSLYSLLGRVLPQEQSVTVFLGACRCLGSLAYSEEQVQIVDILQQALGRVYRREATLGGLLETDPLPRRARQVLARLAAGDSEKEAAVALGLSPHTVHAYIKTIYRRLEVSSRGQLLARLLGDGLTPRGTAPMLATGVRA